ncbi:hypothetical protein GQ42DRAFT_88940 [Ramicandelaber brevisporus]|nr:hypothetical protein GQ42DRAFT_88940 [Ramicandelaber brevisporus]
MTPASRTTTTTTTTSAATAAVRSSRSTRQTAAAAAQLNAASTTADSEHSNDDTDVDDPAVGTLSHKRRWKSRCGRRPGQKPVHTPLCPKHCQQCNKGFSFPSEIARHLNCEKHKKASEVDKKRANKTRFDKQAKCFDKNLLQLKEDYMNQSASLDDPNSYSAGSEDCVDCLELRDCVKLDCNNHPRIPTASPSASPSPSPSPKRHHTNESTPVNFSTAGNASPFDDMDSSDIVIEPRHRNQPDYYENSEDELHLVYEEEEDYEMAESDDDDDGSSLTIDYGDGHSSNDTGETMDNSTVQPPAITSALLCDFADTGMINSYFTGSNSSWSTHSTAIEILHDSLADELKTASDEHCAAHGSGNHRACRKFDKKMDKIRAAFKRSATRRGNTMADRVKHLLPESDLIYAPKRNTTKPDGNGNGKCEPIMKSFGVANAAWLIEKVAITQPDILDLALAAPSGDTHSLHIVASLIVRLREPMQAICVQGCCFDTGVHITAFLFEPFIHMRYTVGGENGSLPCVVLPYRILCINNSKPQLICFAAYFNSDNRIGEAAEVVVDLKSVLPYPVEPYSGNGRYGYATTVMQQLYNKLNSRLSDHFNYIPAYNKQLQKHLDVVLPTAQPPPPYDSNLPASYCLDFHYVANQREKINSHIENQRQSPMSSGSINTDYGFSNSNVIVRNWPLNLWIDGLGTVEGKSIDSVAISPTYLADSFGGERIIPIALNNNEKLCGHHLVKVLEELENGYTLKKDGILYILFSPICICPADAKAMSEVHEFPHLNCRNGCRLCMSTIQSTHYNKLPLSSLREPPPVLRTLENQEQLSKIAIFLRQLPLMEEPQSSRQRARANNSSASTSVATASKTNKNNKGKGKSKKTTATAKATTKATTKTKTKKTATAKTKTKATSNKQQEDSGRSAPRFIARPLFDDDDYITDMDSDEDEDDDEDEDEDGAEASSDAIATQLGNITQLNLESFGLTDMQGFRELLIRFNLLKQVEAGKVGYKMETGVVDDIIKCINKAKHSKSGVYHELAKFVKSRLPLAAFPLDGLHLLAIGVVSAMVNAVATAKITVNSASKDEYSDYDPQYKLPKKRQHYIDHLIKQLGLSSAKHNRPIMLTAHLKSATGGSMIDLFIALVEVILEKVEKYYPVPELSAMKKLLKIYNLLYKHECDDTPLEYANMVDSKLKKFAKQVCKLAGWKNPGGKKIFEKLLKATPKMHHFIHHSAPFLYLTGSFHYTSTQRYERTNKIARSVALAMNNTKNTTFFATLRLLRVSIVKLHHQRLTHDTGYQLAAAEATAAEWKRYFMARAAKKRDTIARRSAAAAPDNGDGDGDEEAVSDASDASDTMDVD